MLCEFNYSSLQNVVQCSSSPISTKASFIMALFKMNSGYMVFHFINCRFDYTTLQNGVSFYAYIFFILTKASS